jgi:hypothetical protein
LNKNDFFNLGLYIIIIVWLIQKLFLLMDMGYY